MISEVRHRISENRDKIELFIIKATGTILTLIGIIGYLDSVSRISLLLDIHYLILAAILLMITLAGFSVYVYKMMSDISGDATLLNHLFMGFAISNQIRTTIIFFWLVCETVYPMKNNVFQFAGIYGSTLSTIFVIWTIFSISCTILLKKKRPESYLDLSQKNPIVVMLIFGTNLVLTLIVFFSGFSLEDFEKRIEYYHMVAFPISVAAFCVLLKVNEEDYEIVARVKRRLRKMLSKCNSVSPFEHVNNINGSQVTQH